MGCLRVAREPIDKRNALSVYIILSLVMCRRNKCENIRNKNGHLESYWVCHWLMRRYLNSVSGSICRAKCFFLLVPFIYHILISNCIQAFQVFLVTYLSCFVQINKNKSIANFERYNRESSS